MSVYCRPSTKREIQTLGITCMLWIIFQVLLGGGSVWFGGKAFGGGMKAKLLWKYHRYVDSYGCHESLAQ